MLKTRSGGAAAVVLAAVTCAYAQDAVQWRVEDGGNGHWYASIGWPTPLSWFEARDVCGDHGGHLATVTSAAEAAVVRELAGDPQSWNGRVGPWLGGYQDSGPRVVEPDGGWRWVTEEDWFDGWGDQWGEPSNGPPGWPESYLHFIGSPPFSCAQDIPNRHWNDFPEFGFGDSCTPAPKGFVLEWSADCNGDGIVDYGQILDGTYADEDGNGVPDVCQVAQWRVEDGGNGHWYLVLTNFTDWLTADGIAKSLGGHLATPKSEGENTFLHDRLSDADSDSAASCWLGLKQQPDSREPEGGWVWVDGSRLDWSRWASGEPDNQNYSGTTTGACFAEMYLGGPTWADTGDASGNSGVGHPAVEWSADCNGDGIVDYGQILDGTYADEDGNGVPDCCEAGCPGDLNGDDRVDSADLGLLIAAWNTDGSIVAGSDINEDGIVNAADLGMQIGSWGECGGCG